MRLPLVYGPGVGANFLALLDAVARRRVLPLGAVRARRSLLYVGNLATAIENATLHRDARWYAGLLAMLYEAGKEMGAILELDVLCDHVAGFRLEGLTLDAQEVDGVLDAHRDGALLPARAASARRTQPTLLCRGNV